MTQRQPLLIAIILALAFGAIPTVIAIASEAIRDRRAHAYPTSQKDSAP